MGGGGGGFLRPGVKSKVKSPLWLLVKYKRWHINVKIEPGSTSRFTHDSTYHCILSRGFWSVLHGVEAKKACIKPANAIKV